MLWKKISVLNFRFFGKENRDNSRFSLEISAEIVKFRLVKSNQIFLLITSFSIQSRHTPHMPTGVMRFQLVVIISQTDDLSRKGDIETFEY